MKKTTAILTLALCTLPAPRGDIAMAHSWYPPECCHNQDCAPITRMDRLPNGDYSYVTPHGAAVISANTSVRDSKDHRIHACIRFGRLVCLFFPPFN